MDTDTGGDPQMSTTSTKERLAAHYLHATGDSSRLGSTVALTAQSLRFPMAQLNILDDRFQTTLRQYGMNAPERLPAGETVCRHTVEQGGVLAVEDLGADPRFADIPGVAAGVARSYLGVALAGRESRPVGSLCVIDPEPRKITTKQIDMIREIGAIAEVQLDQLRSTAERDLAQPGEAAELFEAIEVGEIVPWYQPIVALDTGRITSYEALARWQRPDGSVVDPSAFLATAESSDLVIDLDLAILRQAAAQLRRWRRDRPELRINVNLSTRHLEVAGGVDAVHAALAADGLPADAVTVEITETRGLQDEAMASASVSRLRTLGHRVTLDDFGSGWSSLDWILALPVTGVKVDRTVTERFGEPAGDATHRAIQSLVRELGLESTVEGISTDAQHAAALSLGYDHGQGYWWSAPRPASG